MSGPAAPRHYFLCAAGVTLRAQVNARWPERDKRSDGWIGDSSHSSRTSDHNPDWSDPLHPGVVRAIDIDEDLIGPDFADPDIADRFAEELRTCGAIGEPRLRYVIFERRIAQASLGWAWRPYSGPNPHDLHIHVSFTRAGDDDGRPFSLPLFEDGAGTDTPVVLRRGSRGERVRVVQQSLAARGFDVGAADGVFGPRTEAAVRAFQTHAWVTGKVDTATALRLGVSLV